MALIAMTMTVSAQMRSVGEITVGDCRYAINEKDNTVAVCTGLSPAGEQKVHDIEILEEVTIDGKAYKVTQIGKNAFYEADLKTIILPNTLERINSEAFSFSMIEKINFPESLRTIDGHAFFRCLSLEEIDFASNGYLEISSQAFDTCPVKRLYFPKRGGLLMPQAFIRCDIEEIAFSEDCGMALSTASFYSNKVSEIIIPGDLKLGFKAFDGLSGLTRIVLKAKKNGERKGITSGMEFHGAGSYSGGNRLTEFVSESVLPPQLYLKTLSVMRNMPRPHLLCPRKPLRTTARPPGGASLSMSGRLPALMTLPPTKQRLYQRDSTIFTDALWTHRITDR